MGSNPWFPGIGRHNPAWLPMRPHSADLRADHIGVTVEIGSH
jgi:hypothetical protein